MLSSIRTVSYTCTTIGLCLLSCFEIETLMTSLISSWYLSNAALMLDVNFTYMFYFLHTCAIFVSEKYRYDIQYDT